MLKKDFSTAYISDAKLGIDQRNFIEYDKDYISSQNKDRESFKLSLVKVFKADGIKMTK